MMTLSPRAADTCSPSSVADAYQDCLTLLGLASDQQSHVKYEVDPLISSYTH